ncbi:cell division protein FtsA [Alloiococcus sp. CFN-8]|uniref:cell division protein FtsA n=1 Tax=Alloiococcus sp. CFN-8 TaxID=3416081 RepID=UPI003CF6C745
MVDNKSYVFSLDIGTRVVKGLYGYYEDNKLKIICEEALPQLERAMKDGQIQDIEKVAQVVRGLKESIEAKLGEKLCEVVIAAAGRSLKTVISKAKIEFLEETTIDKDIIRTLELQGVALGEEKVIEEGDRLFCVGYKPISYYLNGYLIGNLYGQVAKVIEVDMISTFLPRSVVDSLYKVMELVGLKVVNLTLEPIAAMEAVIPEKLRLLNIALIDIGAGTSDIAICSNNTVQAYGMVPIAGDEITEAIAKELMVDFLTAEEIKTQCNDKEELLYKDIFGFENNITSQELIKKIEPSINNLVSELREKVIFLNGGVSPSAVFLVGGGAHTPQIESKLAKELDIAMQRVGIRDRKNIELLENNKDTLGSSGVTVVGIALEAAKNIANNFVKVYLNDEPITIFHKKNIQVRDAFISGGIDPQKLLFKNGRNLYFQVNGIHKVVFGTLGEPGRIIVNGETAALDTEIKNEDKISFLPARDGISAESRIIDILEGFDSKRIIFLGEEVYLIPEIKVNGVNRDIDYLIKDGDTINIITIETLEALCNNKSYYNEVFVNGKKESKDYIINDGDIITSIEDIAYNNVRDNNSLEKLTKGFIVKVNGEEVILSGKDNYIFVDIFDFYTFDLSSPKGIIALELNGSPAEYFASLKEGDNLSIYWKE